MNSAQRIKIVEKGWGNFNGTFGGVEFLNSLSVEAVAPATARQLGSLVRIELCDSEAQITSNSDYLANKETPAKSESTLIDVETANAATKEHQKVEEAAQYTREDLEKVADQRGIAGVREIADTLGVRGRSIAELIDAILAKAA